MSIRLKVMRLLLMFGLSMGFLTAGHMGLIPASAEETSDPYGTVRLSRLSLMEGEVLLQRGDDEDWLTASINMPLRPHDKLWATNEARTEIQFDSGIAVRLAGNTNMDLLDLATGWTQLQLTLGVANFNARSASQRTGDDAFLEVDTPQAAIRANRSTKFRVDVAEDGSTEITVREGEVELSSDREPIVVAKNQRVVIEGGDSPRYLLETAQEPDEWDRWNEVRDREVAQARSREHLAPSIAMGASDLDAYGRWTEVPEYGRVWAPAAPVGWAPYQAGRWVWVEPWGWTWVSYEPWGWTTYHYGRWIVVRDTGWVWVPGPTPVWSPGYVRFIYGPDWVGWVPLAPGEAYYFNPGPSSHVEVNLINYRMPNAVTVVSRQTFVTGIPTGMRFIPPRDPIRAGRIAAGPPPVVPTRDSLRPAPNRVVRASELPPAVIQRPVVYRRSPSSPPVLFEHRVNELKDVVKEGRPPITGQLLEKERPAPRAEDRGGPDGIHKGITVRKAMKETGREGSRVMPLPPTERLEPTPPPPAPRLPDKQKPVGPPGRPVNPPPDVKAGQPHVPKQFDLGKKGTDRSTGARSLYRDPPKPEKKQGPAPSEKGGRPDEKRQRTEDR